MWLDDVVKGDGDEDERCAAVARHLSLAFSNPTRSTRSGFGPGTGRGSQAQAIVTIAPSLWWDRLRETSFVQKRL